MDKKIENRQKNKIRIYKTTGRIRKKKIFRIRKINSRTDRAEEKLTQRRKVIKI